jgi:di/tricarboxylate transporter
MVAVSHAFETTGMAELIGYQFFHVGGWVGPAAGLAALLVATMLLTNVLNNTATALFMAPIAISIAHAFGTSIDPFLMAVAIGASAAFLTPIGHHSNAMVMEPGGYKFGDYWRLGLPVSLAVAAAAVPLILWVWPM